MELKDNTILAACIQAAATIQSAPDGSGVRPTPEVIADIAWEIYQALEQKVRKGY